MSIDAGSVYSSVRIRLDQLDGDLKGVYARLNQLETSAKQTSQSVAKSFDIMNVAAVASMVGIGAAIKTAVTQFAGFEQSMANVASVAGGSAEDFERMTAAAKTAGATTRFTASEAADAMYYLASAGLDAGQSIDALDGVLKLAGATQSDLAYTSAALTATIAQFGLEAADATRVSNVFTAAIGNSQATMTKLADSMRYVGAVAGAFGISLEETTGALQILYNAGYQGEQAGTILRNVLSDLANNASPAVAKLKDLGIAFEEVNPAVHGLGEIVEVFQKKGLTAAQALAVFGDRAGPGMVSLLKAGEGAIESYTEAVTGTNAATEAYAKQNDTLAGSFDEMTSAAESAGISLGKVFGPILRTLLGALRDIFLAVSEAPPLFQALAGSIGVGIAAVSAAIPVLKLFGVALGTAAGPLGWIALGITAVGTAATLVSGKVKENTKRLDEMAESAGITADQAKKLENALNRTDISGANIQSVEKDVQRLAKELGVSERAVVDLGLASKKLSEPYKALLLELRPTTIELETQKRIIQDMATAEDILLEKALKRKAVESATAEAEAKKALAKAAQEAEEKRIEALVKKRADTLKKYEETLAGINSLEKAGYLGVKEANEQRIEANDKLIKDLQELGYLSEADGKIGWDIVASAIARVAALRRVNEELTKAAEVNKEGAEAEKKKAKEIADANEAMIEKTAEYNEMLKAGEKTRAQEISDWAAKEVSIVSASKATEDYKNKAISAINNVAQVMRDKSASEAFKANLQAAFTVAIGLASALVDVLQAGFQKNIEDLEAAELEKLRIREEANAAALELELERLDAQLQAELYAKGLTGAATEEQFREQLRLAQETGDEEKIKKAQDELDKFLIEEKYRKLREQAEQEKLAKDKQIAKERAQIEYQYALASWHLQIAAASAQAAIAVINGLATQPFVPAGIAAGALASGLGAAQIAQVLINKPRPAFETGGIVPGNSFTGDNVSAALNSGEMVLTRAQQAELFKLANGASGSAMHVSIPVSFAADGFREFMVGVIDLSIQNGEVAIDARKLTNMDAAVRGAR